MYKHERGATQLQRNTRWKERIKGGNEEKERLLENCKSIELVLVISGVVPRRAQTDYMMIRKEAKAH